MTREEFQSNDAQVAKLSDAVSTLAALDLFPFFRFLNQKTEKSWCQKQAKFSASSG